MTAQQPVGLSRDCWRLTQAIFPLEQQEDVAKLLVEECGANLPLVRGSDDRRLDRIRFAALKQSEGQIDKLLASIVLAQIDWRDLLVAAGFAHSIDAHASWAERFLKA